MIVITPPTVVTPPFAQMFFGLPSSCPPPHPLDRSSCLMTKLATGERNSRCCPPHPPPRSFSMFDDKTLGNRWRNFWRRWQRPCRAESLVDNTAGTHKDKKYIYINKKCQRKKRRGENTAHIFCRFTTQWFGARDGCAYASCMIS